MKPTIIQSKKDLIKLEFDDIDQGFITLVKDQLWEDKATELAGFRVTHPETGKLVLTLRTKGKDAKKVWNDSLSKLSKKVKDFGSQTSKIK